MDYEEDMKQEKGSYPNYFNEWFDSEKFNERLSERFSEDFNNERDSKTSVTIINYFPLYEIELSNNKVEIDYGSDEEYNNT